jgi:DNA-binding response OmpR family regulator
MAGLSGRSPLAVLWRPETQPKRSETGAGRVDSGCDRKPPLPPTPPPGQRFGRFELRPAERALLVDGQPAALGARAFDLPKALAERRDRVVPKNELLDLVWPGLVVEENNLQAARPALQA